MIVQFTQWDEKSHKLVIINEKQQILVHQTVSEWIFLSTYNLVPSPTIFLTMIPPCYFDINQKFASSSRMTSSSKTYCVVLSSHFWHLNRWCKICDIPFAELLNYLLHTKGCVHTMNIHGDWYFYIWIIDDFLWSICNPQSHVWIFFLQICIVDLFVMVGIWHIVWIWFSINSSKLCISCRARLDEKTKKHNKSPLVFNIYHWKC